MFIRNRSNTNSVHISARYKNLGSEYNVKTKKSPKLPELYMKLENCCGCSACYAVCPVSAISMEADDEGFLYPVVDVKKCVCCYKCREVYAFKGDQKEKDYL